MEPYKVKFLGGRLDGGTAEYGSKIGGYIRIRHSDNVVEEYHRTTGDEEEGVYERRDD